MTVRKNEKHKTVAVVENIIKWLFYVELVIMSLTLLSYWAGDITYGVEFVLIPPFSILIALLSLFIVTRLKHSSNLVRIAIALNWVVVLLLIWNVAD